MGRHKPGYLEEYRKRNREQERARYNKWAAKNKAKKRVQERAYRLGFSPEDVEKWLAETTHCPICGLEFTDTYQQCIDHCHETGAFRGVICRACNSGIGHLKDDPEIVRNALHYLSNDTQEDQ